MVNFVNIKRNVDNFIHTYDDKLFGKESNTPFQLSAQNEPTFLTFSLEFIFNPIFLNNLHMFNSPLFIGATNPISQNIDINLLANRNSALAYLKGRGLAANYNRLNKFIITLQELSNNSPWFFQSISGLNSLWENGSSMASGNFKGKDKVLEIGTLESLDLSITYLADLYRKSVYDTMFMREVVPENLRYFQVDVYVAEFRNFMHIKSNTPDDKFIENNVEFFINNSTFYKFSCYMCEFDFSKTFAGGDSLDVKGPDGIATNNFNIKVNNYLEQHEFGFSDIITADTWAKYKAETIKQDTKTVGAYSDKLNANIIKSGGFNINTAFGMVNDVKYAAKRLGSVNADNAKILANDNAIVNSLRNFGNALK